MDGTWWATWWLFRFNHPFGWKSRWISRFAFLPGFLPHESASDLDVPELCKQNPWWQSVCRWRFVMCGSIAFRSKRTPLECHSEMFQCSTSGWSHHPFFEKIRCGKWDAKNFRDMDWTALWKKIDVRTAYNRKDFSRQQNSLNSNSPRSLVIIRPMTQVKPASSYGIARWVGFEIVWMMVEIPGKDVCNLDPKEVISFETYIYRFKIYRIRSYHITTGKITYHWAKNRIIFKSHHMISNDQMKIYENTYDYQNTTKN